MGWTKRSVGVTVLLVMEEHRRSVGQRAVQLRESKGLTQEDLAHKAGLTTKTISRFENGRHEGRSGTITAIARALDVDYSDLVGTPPAPFALGDDVTQMDRIEAKLDALLDALTLNVSPADVVEEVTAQLEATRNALAQGPADTVKKGRAAS